MSEDVGGLVWVVRICGGGVSSCLNTSLIVTVLCSYHVYTLILISEKLHDKTSVI